MSDFEPRNFILGRSAERLTVDSFANLTAFIEQERALWKVLQPRDSDPDRHGLWNRIVEGQNEVAQAINTVAAGNGDLPWLESVFQQRFGGTLRYSGSAEGAKILDIAETAGPAAGRFAYGLAAGVVQPSSAASTEELRGAVLFVAPELQIPAALADRLAKERANMRQLVRDSQARFLAIEHQHQAEAAAINGRSVHIAAHEFWRLRRTWRLERDARRTGADQITSEMEALKQSYLERMRLQAPVEYWNSKAAAHQAAERRAVTHLRIFFPIAAIILAASFGGAAALLLRQSGAVATTTYFLLSAGLASLAAMSFWVGRILTKLYFSQHHLRQDAEERAVMTTTYLALTREQAADASDRQIILNALFRPTADGIVKEDGPDLGLASLVARLAARP